MNDMVSKVVGTAGLVGGAVMLSPLGFPFLFHGVSGIIVGGLGLYAANAVMGKIAEEGRQAHISQDEQTGDDPSQDDILLD